MKRYARPVSAAKQGAPPTVGRPPRHSGPQRSAIWHAIQLRAAQSAASAPRSPSRAGLPASLKAGVEKQSGIAMDDVRVHRDSPEPARLGALAYAKGADIHLGPGQERHLPHEAWHVVQQKQGRVAATTQLRGIAINEDARLEREADIMGARAAASAQPAAAELARAGPIEGVVQRIVNLRQGQDLTQPTVDQLLVWLGQGAVAQSPMLRSRVIALVESATIVTVPWAYGQRAFMETLQLFWPVGENPLELPLPSPLRALGWAFRSWLHHWAPAGPDDESAQANLRANWAVAANHLEGMLRAVGVDPRPGNQDANASNFTRFNTKNRLWLTDMLTILHDLREFGPLPGFRPQQTLATAKRWADLFGKQ